MDKKQNTEAIEAFITHKGNIANLLKHLTAMNDDFMGKHPDEVSWSHVGTLAEIQNQLENAARFAGLNTAEILDSE